MKVTLKKKVFLKKCLAYKLYAQLVFMLSPVVQCPFIFLPVHFGSTNLDG